MSLSHLKIAKDADVGLFLALSLSLLFSVWKGKQNKGDKSGSFIVLALCPDCQTSVHVHSID